MFEWKAYNLARRGEAWTTDDFSSNGWECIWVMRRKAGWCVESDMNRAIIAGPFKTKEQAMLAAELLFE